MNQGKRGCRTQVMQEQGLGALLGDCDERAVVVGEPGAHLPLVPTAALLCVLLVSIMATHCQRVAPPACHLDIPAVIA